MSPAMGFTVGSTVDSLSLLFFRVDKFPVRCWSWFFQKTLGEEKLQVSKVFVNFSSEGIDSKGI